MERAVISDGSDGHGILVLGPSVGRDGWHVVEVDSDVFAGLSVNPDLIDDSHAHFESASGALNAAHDLLTLMAEGRIPAMHERLQESVRDFVRTLEARGYDREAAVKILLDMADRRASDPPKAIRPRQVHRI